MFIIERERIIDAIAPLVRESPEGMFRWKTQILKNPFLFEKNELVEAKNLIIVMLDEENGDKEVVSIEFVDDFKELQEWVQNYDYADFEMHILAYDIVNALFKEVPIKLGVFIEDDSENDLGCACNCASDCEMTSDTIINKGKPDVFYSESLYLGSLGTEEFYERALEHFGASEISMTPFVEIADCYIFEYLAIAIRSPEEEDEKIYLKEEKNIMNFCSLENALDYAMEFLSEESMDGMVTLSDNWCKYTMGEIEDI